MYNLYLQKHDLLMLDSISEEDNSHKTDDMPYSERENPKY